MNKSIVTLLKAPKDHDVSAERAESGNPAEDLIFLVGPKAQSPHAAQASTMRAFSKAGARMDRLANS